MKKTFISIAMVFVLALVASAQIQVVVPFFNGKQLARNAGDSSNAAISLAYKGTNPAIFPGQYPDSIRVTGFSNGDSTASCWIHFKAGISGSGIQTTGVIDSIASTTVAAYQLTTLVPVASWHGYDEVEIALRSSNVNKAPLNAATSSKLTANLVLFYKAQAYRP